jgi:predicted acyl esterase
MKTLTLLCFVPMFLYSQTRTDLFIPVGQSDSLDATYFVPLTPPPDKGYPVIVMVHGFGDDKEARIPSCRIYANLNYLTLAYSVRGQGHSSGRSTIMSFQERSDLVQVLRYVMNMPHIDTTAIGIIGGSQGGLHGLWAASDRLPVKAISADAITPHWASEMFANGSIRRTLLLLLQYPGVRYAPVRDSLWNLVRHDDFDELRSQFSKGRDLDTASFYSSQTPLLQFLKWQDYYFPAAPGIRSFLRYSGKKKLYLGTQGHFSDEIEDEKQYQYGQITGWFNYFLKKLPLSNGIESPITYAISSLPMDTAGYFHWQHATASNWPPDSIHTVRFYLGNDSVLSFRPSAKRKNSFVLLNEYKYISYTFDMGFIEGFRGRRFEGIIPQHTMRFTSVPLDSDMTWVGVPRMNIFVRSAEKVFPLHAQIYEIDSLGSRYFINRINYTARHWKKGSVKRIEVEGMAHAHRFQKGSRIQVVFTNLDCTNRKVLGAYPFVLPVFHNTSATIYFDKTHPSYVEFPFLRKP